MENIEKYKKIKLLGKGKFGEVYLVKDENGKEFALKSIILKSTSNLVSIKREINTLKTLSRYPSCSEYVICYYDGEYDAKEKIMYLLMEYFDGYTVDKYIRVSTVNNEPINYDIILKFTKFLFKALEYIHDHNIAHRDIKAANIMFNKNSIRLIDLGLACYTKLTEGQDSKLKCEDGTFVGSPNYLAPEVWEGTVTDWKKADIWSAGVVVYYISTRNRPFRGSTRRELKFSILYDNYSELPPSYSPILKSVIEHALIKKYKKRATAKDILEIIN